MKTNLTPGQRNLIRFSADLIEAYAKQLAAGHCLPDGSWPADCAAARKDHVKYTWCAQELRALLSPLRRRRQAKR